VSSKPKSRFPKKLSVDEMKSRLKPGRWGYLRRKNPNLGIVFWGTVRQGPFNKPRRTELAIYIKHRGYWKKVYDRETSILHRFTGRAYLHFLPK